MLLAKIYYILYKSLKAMPYMAMEEANMRHSVVCFRSLCGFKVFLACLTSCQI